MAGVQLRYECSLTGEDYVSRQAWREASLARCPLHPHGGCTFHRHGTYRRKTPPGTRVARWYCKQARCTFSVLPDCLAARWRGELDAFEHAVAVAEQAPSLQAAAETLRADSVEPQSALRWLRRRRAALHANLITLKGLMPEHFADCIASVCALREHLGTPTLLRTLRDLAAAHLLALPAPLGLAPPARARAVTERCVQHSTGTDPPSATG